MSYVASDGAEHTPYMIHRAIFGSWERFFGMLVEQYAGAFPLWLAPVQTAIIPITDDNVPYARTVADKLMAAGMRVTIDDRSEKMGYKIREAQLQKVPYMLVIGKKEAEDKTVSVRVRGKGDEGAVSVEDFVQKATALIESKSLDLA